MNYPMGTEVWIATYLFPLGKRGYVQASALYDPLRRKYILNTIPITDFEYILEPAKMLPRDKS